MERATAPTRQRCRHRSVHRRGAEAQSTLRECVYGALWTQPPDGCGRGAGMRGRAAVSPRPRLYPRACATAFRIALSGRDTAIWRWRGDAWRATVGACVRVPSSERFPPRSGQPRQREAPCQHLTTRHWAVSSLPHWLPIVPGSWRSLAAMPMLERPRRRRRPASASTSGHGSSASHL
jgi:hypothetical protein